MKFGHLLVFFAYILCSSAGFVLVKKSSEIASIYFVLGNALYVLGYIIWIGIILRSLPLSVAFPLASAGLLVASQIAGKIFLDENLDLYNLVSILLMLGGLLVLLKKVNNCE